MIGRLLFLFLSFCAPVDSCLESCEASSALVVHYRGGSSADAVFYLKRRCGGWKRVVSARAHVGKNGVGKEAEGDKKTPLGTLHAVQAFGVKPCPGGALPYLELTSSIFACDEPCEFYNTIIDTSVVHHACRGEDMSKMVPAYNYGFSTDYNPECVYPLGSNIFVHCYGRKPWTSGCVALPERVMRRILRRATPDLEVIVL